MLSHYVVLAVLTTLVATSSTPAPAQFTHDPSQNLKLGSGPGDFSDPVGLGDNAGGCFVSWKHYLGGNNAMFLQRLDADGNAMWGPNGVQLSSHVADDRFLVDDTAGGVIVVWTGGEWPTRDVYAQRVDGNGTLLWGAGGIEVATGRHPVLATGNAGALKSVDDGETWTWIPGAVFFGTAFKTPTEVTIVGDAYVCDSLDLAVGWDCNSSQPLNAVAYGGFRGFSVGPNGVVRLRNGGDSWSLAQDQFGGVHAFGVDAFGPYDAIAAADAGNLFGTSDGGSTWASLPNGTSQRLEDVAYHTALIAVAVGHGGTVLRTTDGGNSWTQVTVPTAGDLYGIDMNEAGRGIAVGDPGIALVTSDGGVTWTLVDTGSTQQLHGVSLVGENAAVAVGQAGTLLRSGDRGASWEPLDSGLSADLWGVDAPTTTHQKVHGAVADGAGGVVVVWEDIRSSLGGILYAQRMGANGSPVWPAPTQVSTTPYVQSVAAPVSNGAGGVILAWQYFDNIRARQVDAQGDPVTGVVQVCGAPDRQHDPILVTDDAGGAIVVWSDQRAGTIDTYAARFASDGSLPWQNDGAAMFTGVTHSIPESVVPDGIGGAYVVISDFDTSFADGNVFYRGIDLNGALWGPLVTVSNTLAAWESTPRATADDNGGIFVAWYEEGAATGSFLQHFLGQDRSWPSDTQITDGFDFPDYGLRVSTPLLDGVGGAIVLWDDYDSPDHSVYAQNVDRFGYLGFPEPTISAVDDVPADQGGFLNITWDASYIDVAPDNTIATYAIWSRLAPAGTWTLQSTVPAVQLTQYNTVIPSFGVAYGSNQPITEVQVVAHTPTPSQFWESDSLGGTSTDNLAPDAPSSLVATTFGSVVQLTWIPGPNNTEDTSHYKVYRGADPLFPLDASSLLDASPSLNFLDVAPPGGDVYYRVTAEDIHENEGFASNLALVSIVTAVEAELAPTTVALRHAGPNPFQGSTSVRLALPSTSDVELVLFDIAGRRVNTQTLRQLPPGWHSVALESKDRRGTSLASGVYLLRVSAGGERRSLKLVVSN